MSQEFDAAYFADLKTSYKKYLDKLKAIKHEPYATTDAAAIAALSLVWWYSNQEGDEHAGALYSRIKGKDRIYGFGPPEPGLVTVSIVRWKWPSGLKPDKAGGYHTHVNHGIGNVETHSEIDKAGARSIRLPIYVGTPSGAVKRFGPTSSAPMKVGTVLMPEPRVPPHVLAKTPAPGHSEWVRWVKSQWPTLTF